MKGGYYPAFFIFFEVPIKIAREITEKMRSAGKGMTEKSFAWGD
jgi:hypothetical protein